MNAVLIVTLLLLIVTLLRSVKRVHETSLQDGLEMVRC